MIPGMMTAAIKALPLNTTTTIAADAVVVALAAAAAAAVEVAMVVEPNTYFGMVFPFKLTQFRDGLIY